MEIIQDFGSGNYMNVQNVAMSITPYSSGEVPLCRRLKQCFHRTMGINTHGSSTATQITISTPYRRFPGTIVLRESKRKLERRQ
jgi:hypothetical protein